MSADNSGCTMKCWLAAAVIGVIVFLLATTIGHRGLGTALFLGALAFVLLGLLFNWLYCGKSQSSDDGSVAQSAGRAVGGAAAAGAAAAGAAAATAKSAASSAASATSDAASAAKSAAGDAAASAKETAGAAAQAAKDAASGVADTAADAGATAKQTAADAIDGAKDAASGAAEAVGDAAETAADGAQDVASSAVEQAKDAANDVADAAQDMAGKAQDAAADAADSASTAAAKAKDAVIKPSAALSGEEDLASRKGSWKYDGGATAAGAAASGATAAGTGAAAPAPKDAGTDSGNVDYDGDGVLEGTDEGTRPDALDGPRGGKADNLKEIKGIGPKLEKLCNSLGFYHFDQIANWTADEVAWVNANLSGFKGRVTRDDWVAQAKILAAGGDTEFSKRVDDGKVY